MIFKVNKDDVVRVLEVIIETQQTDDLMFTACVEERAKDLLYLIEGLPLECSMIMLTEEEGKFISEFYK